MGLSLILPTPLDIATSGTWGTTINTAINTLNGADQFARKPADESVTSNTTTQDDNDLVVAVVANGVYLVTWDLRIDGATGGDFKYFFTGPTAATMTWNSMGHAAADTTNVAPTITDAPLISTNVTHGTLGTGTISHIRGNGILVVSVTGGNFQLVWAQGTSSGTATTAKTGSWLLARRVT